MQATVFTQYGPPHGLELRELPKFTPQDDELLVRIQASSINSWDWELLNGTPFVNRLVFGLLRPKSENRVLGADIAGTVEAVGSGISRFQSGDEVFGDLWGQFGGFAEFICVREDTVECKPANATFEEAAAIPQAGVLALQALRKHRELKRRQKVLINGAGGGVGTFAIRLAKLSGAEVTGVDAAHKLDVVKRAGADHLVDFAQADFTMSGERYDFIIDCQNYRSIVDIKRALSADCVYAMVGGSMVRVLQLWILGIRGRLTRSSRRLCLVAEGPNKGLAELKAHMEAGHLVPSIDRTYSLEQVPDAMRYFGAGRHKGKIAITLERPA